MSNDNSIMQDQKGPVLEDIMLYAKYTEKGEYLPLNGNYTYGGKSDLFGGKGECELDKEAGCITFRTCLTVSAKGSSVHVLVLPWNGFKPESVDSKLAIDSFEFMTPRVEDFYFSGNAHSSKFAVLDYSGVKWGSSSAITSMSYIPNIGLYTRVEEKREIEEKLTADLQKAVQDKKEKERRKQLEMDDLDTDIDITENEIRVADGREKQLNKDLEKITKDREDSQKELKELLQLKRKIQADDALPKPATKRAKT